MLPVLKDSCLVVDSSLSPYNEEFKIPINCRNLNIKVCKINASDLSIKLEKRKKAYISQELIKNLEDDFYKQMCKNLRWR